jgi:hypothetical protein
VERRGAVDADALRFEVFVEPFHAELAADAAALDARRTGSRRADVVRVDPDVADAQPPRERIARSRSLVQTALPSPSGLSLAIARASSSSSNVRTDRTGPKISSRAIDICGLTSSKIVGAM